MKKRLRYEFLDTILSMGIGWAINSAMIILAAATFFAQGVCRRVRTGSGIVGTVNRAVGRGYFCHRLTLCGACFVGYGRYGGSQYFAGMFGESYDMKDLHSRIGLALTYIPALVLILFIQDSFKALLVSQMFLSLQLPFTIFLQLYLTGSAKVMGYTKTNRLRRLCCGLSGLW